MGSSGRLHAVTGGVAVATSSQSKVAPRRCCILCLQAPERELVLGVLRYLSACAAPARYLVPPSHTNTQYLYGQKQAAIHNRIKSHPFASSPFSSLLPPAKHLRNTANSCKRPSVAVSNCRASFPPPEASPLPVFFSLFLCLCQSRPVANGSVYCPPARTAVCLSVTAAATVLSLSTALVLLLLVRTYIPTPQSTQRDPWQ